MHSEVKKLSQYKNRSGVAPEFTNGIEKVSSNFGKAEILADQFESIHDEAFLRDDVENTTRIDAEMKESFDNNEPMIKFSKTLPARIDFIEHIRLHRRYDWRCSKAQQQEIVWPW